MSCRAACDLQRVEWVVKLFTRHCAVYIAVGQYGSETEGLSSRVSDVSGCGSCCYDNGAVGGLGVSVTVGHASVTTPDLWCCAATPGKKPADLWSTVNDSEDLAALLSRIGLGKYTDIFQQQEVCERLRFFQCFWFLGLIECMRCGLLWSMIPASVSLCVTWPGPQCGFRG